MKGLREKFRNNKGFTLIEMLIVVAIIAILIAVSIPLVGSALEKARDATDQANERAAKAEAAIYYLGVGDKTLSYTSGEATMYYDAENGKLLAANDEDAKKITYYGKCTATHTTGSYIKNSGDHSTKIIKVVIKEADGSVVISWDDRPS